MNVLASKYFKNAIINAQNLKGEFVHDQEKWTVFFLIPRV